MEVPHNRSPQVDRNALELEYGALRDEILKRIELRQQIISIALTLLTAILSATFVQKGLESSFPMFVAPPVVFIYPPIATSLALGWAQQDYRINLLGRYIHEHIEKSIPDLDWERYVVASTGTNTRFKWYYILLSNGSVFIWTEIISILIGISMLKGTFSQICFVIFDSLSLILVVIILYRLYEDTLNQKKSIISEQK